MQGRTGRLIAGAVVVVIAIVLFVVLRDGGDESGSNSTTTTSSKSGGAESGGGSKPKPAIPTIVIKGGKPVGGVMDLTYSEGDRIRFKVASNVSDEIHVHGYDLAKDVEAGGSVSFDFPADITGIFEAELEGRGEQIAELRVNP